MKNSDETTVNYLTKCTTISFLKMIHLLMQEQHNVGGAALFNKAL
jgi:hypothetical protein